MTSSRTQRGSAAVEATLIIPAVVLFAGLVAWLGWHVLVNQSVAAAANHAARAATMERDPAAARQSAATAAQRFLDDAGVECANPNIAVDAAALANPLGTSDEVQVSLSCSVSSWLPLPGLPANAQFEATGSAPVDAYRGR